MSATTLYRIDADKNMRRFYRLDVQADLFGAWCFIREWGRIGKSGQVCVVPYPTTAAAPQSRRGQRCPAGSTNFQSRTVGAEGSGSDVR
jgi:predicted DNA-binding WGR domain protein